MGIIAGLMIPVNVTKIWRRDFIAELVVYKRVKSVTRTDRPTVASPLSDFVSTIRGLVKAILISLPQPKRSVFYRLSKVGSSLLIRWRICGLRRYPTPSVRACRLRMESRAIRILSFGRDKSTIITVNVTWFLVREHTGLVWIPIYNLSRTEILSFLA